MTSAPPPARTDARLNLVAAGLVLATWALYAAQRSHAETRKLLVRQQHRLTDLQDGPSGRAVDGALERLHAALARVDALEHQLRAQDGAIAQLSRQLVDQRVQLRRMREGVHRARAAAE